MSPRFRALLATTFAAVALAGCSRAPAHKTASVNASNSPAPGDRPAPATSPAPDKSQEPFPADHRRAVDGGRNGEFAGFRRRVGPGGTSDVRVNRTVHGVAVY